MNTENKMLDLLDMTDFFINALNKVKNNKYTLGF